MTVPPPSTGILGPLGPGAQRTAHATDGVKSGLAVFTTFKYYDVAKFHTNTNHYFITSIGTVSKKWFDAQPPEIQRAILEETRAVHAELLDWTKNFYQTAVNTWKEKTKEGWIELTADQRTAFQKQLEGVDGKVAQEVPALREWLDFVCARARAPR